MFRQRGGGGTVRLVATVHQAAGQAGQQGGGPAGRQEAGRGQDSGGGRHPGTADIFSIIHTIIPSTLKPRKVSDLGDNIQEWKRKTFGGFRRGGDQEDDDTKEQSSTDDIDVDILISENDTTIFDDTQEATTTIIEVEAEEDEDRKESDLPLKNETNLV